METLKLDSLLRVAILPVAAAAAMAALPADAASSGADNYASAKSTADNKAEAAPYRALRASRILGKEVRNREGRNIGQIRDLVVDMTTGQVRYAMLEFDPGIFEGERLFAVPTTELRLGSDDQLLYNMTRDKLEQAAVPRADWKSHWRDSLANADKVWKVGGVAQPSDNARAYRASDLLGMDVNSRSGEDIGDLKDLVINMATQKVHYAVLAFDPSWLTPEKNYAFPLTAFKLGKDKDELVLDVDKSKIRAMKGFDDRRYSNLNDRDWVAEVDRYIITFIPATARAGTTTSGSAKDSASAAELFSRLDTDHNGWLDNAEAKDNAEGGREWARLDADKDGRVSRDEFTNGHTAAATGSAKNKGG